MSTNPTDVEAIPVSPKRVLVLASRVSTLAQMQTFIVRDAFQAAYPELHLDTLFLKTSGDNNPTTVLYDMAGKGLWTDTLDAALRTKTADVVVHSMKDVPTEIPQGTEIAAILERHSPVDCLVVKAGLEYKSLSELPEGCTIGTSSIRRIAQLRRNYPKFVFSNIRGSLGTRLAKLDAPDGHYTAIVLARAGLDRLGMGHRVTEILTAPTLFHAVGQGGLAIQIRSDDTQVRELCKAVTHWQSEWVCFAERALLRTLDGGCSVPVGVQSAFEVRKENSGKPKGELTLTGCVTSIDGTKHVEHTVSECVESRDEAEVIGTKLAITLIETGAKAILDEIREDKRQRILTSEQKR